MGVLPRTPARPIRRPARPAATPRMALQPRRAPRIHSRDPRRVPSTLHPAIVSVGRALPPNHVDQETLIAALTAYWGARHFNVGRLADVHRHAGVGGRHLALPLAEYPGLDTFAKSNDAFIRVGADVGEAAVRAGL